jgi:hypothetical protein
VISSGNINSGSRALLLCGFAGPLLFVLSFFVHGLLRDDYSAIAAPVSALVSGRYGWIQTQTFLISGLLICSFSLGFYRVAGQLRNLRFITILFFLAGSGLIGAGIFPSGAGSKPFGGSLTLAARLHYLFSMLLYTCLPLSCFLLLPGFKKAGLTCWYWYSQISVILVIVFFVLTVLAMQAYAPLAGYAGLFQKLSICFGFAWLALLALAFSPGLRLHRKSG